MDTLNILTDYSRQLKKGELNWHRRLESVQLFFKQGD